MDTSPQFLQEVTIRMKNPKDGVKVTKKTSTDKKKKDKKILVCQGNHIVDWLLKDLGEKTLITKQDALNISQALLDRELITKVDGNNPKRFSDADSYTFSDEAAEALEIEILLKNSDKTQIIDVARAMGAEGGIQLKEKKYRLRKYKNCFTGAEAVEWLQANLHIDKQNDTMNLANKLQAKGYFINVLSKTDPVFNDKAIYKLSPEVISSGRIQGGDDEDEDIVEDDRTPAVQQSPAKPPALNPPVPQRRPPPPARTSSTGTIPEKSNINNNNNSAQATSSSPLSSTAPVPGIVNIANNNNSNPPAPSPLASVGDSPRGRGAPPRARGLVPRGGGEGRGGHPPPPQSSEGRGGHLPPPQDLRSSGELNRGTGEFKPPSERGRADFVPGELRASGDLRGRGGENKRGSVPGLRRPPPPLESPLSTPALPVPTPVVAPPEVKSLNLSEVQTPSPALPNLSPQSPSPPSPSQSDRPIPKPPARKVLSQNPINLPSTPSLNTPPPIPTHPSLPSLAPTLPSLNPPPSPKKDELTPPRSNWQAHRKVPSSENTPPMQQQQQAPPPRSQGANIIQKAPQPRKAPPPPKRTFVPEQSIVLGNIDPGDEVGLIKMELLSSEQSFVNSCLLGLNVYNNIDPSQISEYERESIFANIQEIADIHKSALHSSSSSVGDILLSLIPNFRLYWKYIANLSHALSTVNKLKERGVFDSILQYEVSVPSIESFLDTPHRHLGEYPSLIRDYIQRLQLKDTNEVEKLNRAIVEFDIIYDEVKRRDYLPNHLNRLWDLEFSFENEKPLSFPENTFIVYEGEAKLVRDSSEAVREGYDTLNIFIFNNGNCVLAAPFNGYSLRTLIQSPVSKLAVRDISSDETHFGLEITANMRKLLASFTSLKEKRTWMNHLPVQYSQPRKLQRRFKF